MELEREIKVEIAEIDLHGILNVLNKWRAMIVILTLTALLIAAVLSFFILPAVYEAQTTLLVVQGDNKSTTRIKENDLESIISDISRLPEMTIKTYVEQIKDPMLFSEVIKKLDLTAQNYSYGSLSNMITATSIKDTNLIEIRVRNTDPKMALSIANTLTETFLQSISANSQHQMAKSVQFLQEQAEKVSKDLDEQRNILKEFDSKPRSVAYLEQEQARMMSDLGKYRSSYQDISISYQQISTAVNEFEKQLKDTPATLSSGEENPRYLSLKEELMQKTIVLAEKNTQLKSISSYIKNLEKELNSLQIENTSKKAEQELIRNKVYELQQTYQLLAEKITQTQITSSANLGDTNLQVVSPATVTDNPVKPNKKLNLAIAGILGVVLSLTLAFLLELLDNKITTKEDVEKNLQLAVLGEIPLFTEAGAFGKLVRRSRS